MIGEGRQAGRLMAQLPSGAQARFTGLYRWLLDREEAEARHSMPHPSNPQRLAALRAGRPVDVTAGEIPGWAREGERTHWWRRATVTAAGAVMFWDDDGSAWLAENGL